ncbi:MAG: class I SAM-dependent methyltransferase [Thiohalocapsa sp.]|jgi:methylase of polypeptide subunit release factors|uniref:N5-glutamine methyltransferase family protein n=1 Tax=Thiohalocapsa sp. TaxID=2497641 RepID=UPI0025F51CDA|nr:class I SAM-dependent methyltransferase [Thiohalocapsa sp.]MCG6942502.1 class I SAM-dependent methyltransferase [Thiohalocapsa sp.]
MLTAPSSDEARRLRDFFLASGYIASGIQAQLAVRIPLPSYSPQMPALLARTAGGSTFDLLTRCFFLGQPASEAAVAVLPADILTLLQRCGLLRRDGAYWRPAALLTPCAGLWLASDTFDYRETAQARDYVMPINEPALTLLDFAVPCDGVSVLDLCSGNLMHGLAAGTDAKVVGSDLNPRAALFGAFNAALNARDDVTCVTGDLFAPVAGERFDLILSNPPFVISPGSDHPFRESPLDLDDFSRRLVGEVGEHLNEGGFCQIICEWVELEGQPWQERLTDWFARSGCDAWVLAANRQLPQTYAREWVVETSHEPGPPAPQRYAAWLEHLTARGVTAVHGGLISLRRRTGGENWISFSRIEAGLPGKPIGAAVRQGFRNRDFLHAHPSDAAILDAGLVITPGARLESKAVWRGGSWHPDAMVLSVDDGVPVRLGLDANVIALMERLEQFPTLGGTIADFARAQGLPIADIQGQCLGILRRLLEQGCLMPRTPSGT